MSRSTGFLFLLLLNFSAIASASTDRELITEAKMHLASKPGELLKQAVDSKTFASRMGGRRYVSFSDVKDCKLMVLFDHADVLVPTATKPEFICPKDLICTLTAGLDRQTVTKRLTDTLEPGHPMTTSILIPMLVAEIFFPKKGVGVAVKAVQPYFQEQVERKFENIEIAQTQVSSLDSRSGEYIDSEFGLGSYSSTHDIRHMGFHFRNHGGKGSELYPGDFTVSCDLK